MNTTTINEMNTMENVNTTTLKKEEENTMTTLTEERKEAIERLKEVDTENYYTDDVIEEIKEITWELNIDEIEEDFEDIWDADLIFDYIKDTSEDLDRIIYKLEDCHAGAQYYYRDAYENFRDIEAADLKMLVNCIIMSIEQAE